MRMKIVHASERGILYQHVFLNTSNLGAGLAYEDLGPGVRENLLKSRRRAERNHFRVGSFERDSNRIME